MYTTLINASNLVQKLDTDNVVLLDCRFSLTDTAAGISAFHNAHIPGAYYANLDTDLSAAVVGGVSGRHPLPAPDRFIQQLRQWGVNNDTQIIAYDDAGGAIAARAWWMCRWIGHQASAVLDGGMAAWNEHQLPVTAESTATAPGTIVRKPPLAELVEIDGVLDEHRLLVDARAAERYLGKVEPLDNKAGHIPGAINVPYSGNLNDKGEFLAAEALAARFSGVGITASSTDVTHYCGSGVTAAHNVLAMTHAGLGNSALYAGSWSEWVQGGSRPVATGKE